MNLHLYRGDRAEPLEFPIPGGFAEFSAWAQDAGGEAARLAGEGHTDAYRGADAVQSLREQLADAPGEFAMSINEALTDDVQGVVLVPDEAEQYAAMPSHAGAKLHRDAFEYREADPGEGMCQGCLYYNQRNDCPEIGTCWMFKSLAMTEPEKYNLIGEVGPHMRCEAFEPRPEEPNGSPNVPAESALPGDAGPSKKAA